MNNLIREIFERQPIFADIMRRHGETTLLAYSANLMRGIGSNPYFLPRYERIAGVIKDIVVPRLGGAVAGEVAAQLRGFPLVSTMDHHAIIQHPFWVNSNLVTALGYLGLAEPRPRYEIVLSFSSVSLNNASAYSRGLLLHAGPSLDERLLHIPLLAERYKMASVYGFPGITESGVQRARRTIEKMARAKEVESLLAEKLITWLTKTFASVWDDNDLCGQITKLNFSLWPTICRAGNSLPSLIYIEIEKVTAALLIKEHLNNPASPIYRLLFATPIEIVTKLFGNIRGSFGERFQTGTYFFWGRSECHRRAIFPRARILFETNGNFQISFTPEAINEGLRDGTLFPNMLLSYLVVALYYGLNCLGGFCQVSDLTAVQIAWQKFLRQTGETAEAEAVARTQTQLFGGDGAVLATLPGPKGEAIPATGIDLMIREGKPSFADWKNFAAKQTMWSVITPMIPEIHGIVMAAPR